METALSAGMDFETINRSALARASELLGHWLPDGRLVGREYIARNPTRNDCRPGSFKVNTETGEWSDFATDDRGGDLISLYAYLQGCSQSDAARAFVGTTDRLPSSRAGTRAAPSNEVLVIVPVPETAPAPMFEHGQHGTASQYWAYRDAEGRLLGYIARFDTEKGKEILPLTYCEGPDGHQQWRWKSWPVLRPLYGLDKLTSQPAEPVLVVEGEKTADAAQKLFPEYVVITSPNGSKAAERADWSVLLGRDVTIWPDADEPGAKYAADVAALAQTAGVESVRIVTLSPILPVGWDLADTKPDGMTLEALRECLNAPIFVPVVGWPKRQPVADKLAEVPSLPAKLLPLPLGPWLEDTAERLQVPLEMVAAPAIVAAASVVGRAVGILPKKLDDWLEVPNLWGMIVGRPGMMKSPAMNEANRPIRCLAKKEAQRFSLKQGAAKLARAAIDARISELEHAATKPDADLESLSAELTKLTEAREHIVLTERRYITQDATVEKLGELLRENPRGLFLGRDELSGWLKTLNKLGREGEREFFIDAWGGTGEYTFDRIGRGTVHIPALTLSVFGTIQPGKLQQYVTDATSEGRNDDGLLQRFQVSVWPDISADWQNVDRLPDNSARERVIAAFEALAEITVDRLGGAAADIRGIPALHFAPDAQELFDAWRARLETRLRGSELKPFPAYESHVAKYRKLMPALSLVFHLFDVVTAEVEPGPVTLTAARLAASWVEYLDAHARRIYAVELDPNRRAAHALANRIKRGDITDGMTVRDIYRRQWSELRDSETARAALAELGRLAWVQIRTIKTTGRDTEVVRLHPELIGGDLS